MIKINSSIILELENGQKISLSLKEAKELNRDLAKFIEDDKAVPTVEQRKRKNTGRSYFRQKRKVPGMSEAKKNEILKHVNKKLSEQPRTLSNLIEGISYIPNHLPMIRQIVEDQPHVTKQVIGKRTYYSAKGSGNGVGRHSKVAAIAA